MTHNDHPGNSNGNAPESNDPATEIDTAIASTPGAHALKSVERLLEKYNDDPNAVSELKAIRSRVKELDRNRENAVNRLLRLHDAAGVFLRGMRDSTTKKCCFCGNVATQHEPWCLAWTLIDWRDGNHNRGSKKAEKQHFGADDRPADKVAPQVTDNRRWDENAGNNKAAYTGTLV